MKDTSTRMSPADLRLALKRQKFTQTDFADALELNVRTVRRWMNGEQPIPFWVTYALAGLKLGDMIVANDEARDRSLDA